MKLEDLVIRAEELVQKGQQLLETRTTSSRAGDYVDPGGLAEFRTASLAFLSRIFGEESPNFKEFDKKITSHRPSTVEKGIGILRASKEELEGGWLTTTKGLLSAEIFSDFLEMAEHLLAENYKDAAAVIIGSVLEEHIRQLAQKHGIDVTFEKSGRQIPKKADSLNAELAKAGVYNKLDQKNITAWLDLRNNAAHGRYEEYSRSQVELMHQSVLDFMTRVPV
ncbi:MAG: hypothetical protein E3J21_03730 [Anaerolineales bacterium]|nr:MAG: hypothetical protein E3J21_03730 [Anaerolineales bacterium]